MSVRVREEIQEVPWRVERRSFGRMNSDECPGVCTAERGCKTKLVMLHGVLVFTWLLLLPGVVSSVLGAQTVRRSDSIRVTRYERGAMPPRSWTVDPKPLVEIGGENGRGPTEFAVVQGVLRLQDGRIAVANGATNEIRIFGPDGAFQTSGGRAGSGPGEFRRLLRLAAFADTVAGVDADTRMQVFTVDGRLARSINPIRPEGHRNPRQVGVLRDGSAILFATKGSQQPASDETMNTYSVFRSSREGDSLTRLFDLPGYREVRAGQAPSRLLLDGEGTVAARGDRICAGFSGTFDVTCYDASGMGLWRVVRETAARPPTDDERSLVREAYLAANRDAPPRVREQMERAVREFRFAEHVAAFSRIQISSAGELWVSEFDPATDLPGSSAAMAPTQAQRWSVFSPDGVWLADIALPARFIAHDMGRDYVAGVSFDADDVERVTVWRIRR